MSGHPDEDRTSVQTLLAGTEESAVETLRDRTHKPSEITDPPAGVDHPPLPPVHEEQPKLETSLAGPQETDLPLETPPLEDGTGDGGSSAPEADAALYGQAAGSDDSQSVGVPVEESEALSAKPHVQREGGTGPEGSWSIQIENVAERRPGERAASWGERLRAKIRASFSAPVVSDIEEIGSSSVQDEAAGLRKRQLSEVAAGKAVPKVPVVLAGEDDDDGGITLNKCILVALILLGVGFGIFGFFTDLEPEPDGEEHPPESERLYKRVMDGHLHNDLETPLGHQAWIEPYPDNAEGDPSTVISLSALLDKLANENQQIRMMHVELQAQKDELEGLLKAGGERLPPKSQQNLNLITQQLAEHLLREETTLSALQEELRDLRQKISSTEGGSAEPREEATADEQGAESFLIQKENLVAEALMLRRELDKQRTITISTRQALESLIERVGTFGEGVEAPKILEGLEEMERKLAFELGRSEIWEKVYGKSKDERKKQKEAKHAAKDGGEDDRQEFEDHVSSSSEETSDPTSNATVATSPSDLPLKATEQAEDKSSSDPPSNATREAGDGSAHDESESLSASVKSTFAQLSGAAKVLFRGAQQEPSKDEKRKGKTPGGKHEARDGRKEWKKTDERKDKLWEDKSREGWKGKPRKEWKDGPTGKRDHKDHRHDHQKKPEGRKYLEKDQKYKEHKRQKEAEKHRKKSDEEKQNDEVRHRHHEHNKFWKKDQELKYQKHRYTAPVGCPDVGSCARKEGMDLFNVALEPVRADEFHSLLKDYIQKSNLGNNWGDELEAMVATFFKDGVFIHDQMRFSDFVDDLDDYIEEIAEKLYGDDDAVEDFEDYVFERLFGAATERNRNAKRDEHRSAEHHHNHQVGHRSARDGGQHRRKDWNSKWRPTESEDK